MGLTPKPDEGAVPWTRRPAFWAVISLVILVVLNLYFW
jgi:hypothetical protein